MRPPLPARGSSTQFPLRCARSGTGRAELCDGQPLSFSASSVWAVSARFRLQIPMIPRCERSFGTPQGTIRPLRGRVSLRAAGSAVISLAGEATLVAGSVSLVGRSVSSVIWRFDARTKEKLRTYPSRAVLVTVDRGRLLIDRPRALDVLTRNGALVTTLRHAHEGGAAMRGGRVATLAGRRLVVSRVDGKSLVVRSVAAGAHLEDLDGGLVLYTAETRLHLLRLADGKDVALRLRNQFGYANARLWHGSLFYAYNQRSGRLGHTGFVDAGRLRALLGSR